MQHYILKNSEYCSCRRRSTMTLIAIGGKYDLCSRCTFVLLEPLLNSIVPAVVAHTVFPSLTNINSSNYLPPVSQTDGWV